MGRPEGRHVGRRVDGGQTGGTAHHRHLERPCGGQSRQDARHPVGEHRLARAGWSDHQHMVEAGRGNLHRELCVLLSHHIRHVGHGVDDCVDLNDVGIGPRCACHQRIAHLAQVRHADCPVTDGNLRLAQRRRRHHHGPGACRVREWRDAGRGPQRAIEAKFTHEGQVLHRAVLDATVGHEDADGNCKVGGDATLLLGFAGEVHRDTPVRPLMAGTQERGAHAVPRLPARLVGLTNDGEPGQTVTDVHLHSDRCAEDTVER